MKKNTLFCFFGKSRVTHTHTQRDSIVVGRIRERSISAADVAVLVVVVATRVTHERESARKTRVTREVGTVVKPSITRNTQAVFVFIEFLHALFIRKFESGFMSLRSRHSHAGGGSSSIPVVSSSHRSSFVSESGHYHPANT